MDIFMNMIQALINPQLVLYLAAGVFLGIYIGAVPGLSVTMAASLLISFTYSWDVLPAMAAILGALALLQGPIERQGGADA